MQDGMLIKIAVWKACTHNLQQSPNWRQQVSNERGPVQRMMLCELDGQAGSLNWMDKQCWSARKSSYYITLVKSNTPENSVHPHFVRKCVHTHTQHTAVLQTPTEQELLTCCWILFFLFFPCVCMSVLFCVQLSESSSGL